MALLAPDGNTGEAVVTCSLGSDTKRDHHALPLRAVRPAVRAMHAMHEVMGHFMRHSICQMVAELSREHPGVVANHPLP